VANGRRFELEDLLIRPGTYFNPQTEIMVVVDDSPELDREAFETEALEGAEWVLISDESPLDEAMRDELLERFQAGVHGRDGRRRLDDEREDDSDEEEDDEDDLEGTLEVEDQELDGE
jgi:hypothetical protein